MENDEKKVYDGGVTEADVAKWKNAHRKVYRVDVEDEGETHSAWFRRPDVATMAAVAKVAEGDAVKSVRVLYDNCLLGGDPGIHEDAVLFMAATTELSKMLTSCQGALKNL